MKPNFNQVGIGIVPFKYGYTFTQQFIGTGGNATGDVRYTPAPTPAPARQAPAPAPVRPAPPTGTFRCPC